MYASIQRAMPFSGLIAVGFAIGISACVVDDSQPDDDDGQGEGLFASSEGDSFSSEGVPVNNGLQLNNGLQMNNGIRLQDGTLMSHGLAVGHGLSLDSGLATEAGLSSTTGFLTSEAGQKLVGYLVECALPLGHSITKNDPVRGGTITFDGFVGLAAGWETGACDKNCQEWVSACLLARTNSLGANVSLEMVATHPAIGSKRSRPWTYIFEEAGFYGNLFQDPPAAHTCLGKHALLAALQLRLCGPSTWLTCGFNDTVNACYLGDSCSGKTGDAYKDCRNAQGEAHATITTYTKLL